MNKITAEEALKALSRLSSIAYMNLEDTLLLDEYIYQTRQTQALTFDEVVKAWEDKEGLQVRKSNGVLEVYSEFSKKVYYRIEFDTWNNGIWQNPTYPKRTMQQDDLLQMTRRYLEAQEKGEKQ